MLTQVPLRALGGKECPETRRHRGAVHRRDRCKAAPNSAQLQQCLFEYFGECGVYVEHVVGELVDGLVQHHCL